jgi:hypothetical protein
LKYNKVKKAKNNKGCPGNPGTALALSYSAIQRRLSAPD